MSGESSGVALCRASGAGVKGNLEVTEIKMFLLSGRQWDGWDQGAGHQRALGPFGVGGRTRRLEAAAVRGGGAKRRFIDVATEGRRSADVRGEEAEERVRWSRTIGWEGHGEGKALWWKMMRGGLFSHPCQCLSTGGVVTHFCAMVLL